ncbi:hypothetical protein V2J09_019846 [Rumex salicifolius]
MDTSLRLNGEAKALRIHAKQKFPLDADTYLQAHGELDTKLGAPTGGSLVLRRFFPDLSGSIGIGVRYNKYDRFRYLLHGKKSFPVSSDGNIKFNVKGRSSLDEEFKQRKRVVGAEFVWDIWNFQKEQDVRLKLGYELISKVPYLQIRENNWSLNADIKGRWNIRYDL